PEPIEPLPYIKDLDRLAFRPEGRGYSGGVPTLAEPRGFNFDVDLRYFESVVWPALAHRFPQFDQTRCLSTIAGLYDQNDFDGNVVGAGSAGCILASRLTEDPSVRVLLVEAGGSDQRLIISMPGALPFVYQNKRLGWGFQSGPEPHLDGRTIDEKQGRVIGGTSSINAMIYNRGNPLDYEGWAHEGLPDWSYAHCLPYFRKMETFVDGEDDWRGGSGPMQISRAAAKHKLYDAFLRSGEQAGHAVTADHNAYRQEGFHVAQS